MSEEELKVEITEEVAVEENNYTPAEEKAIASGWRPEDEWEGEAEEWVDARTFNRNGEFMSRIQKQSKQLDSQVGEIGKLKSAMKELGEHNKKIAEKEYNKAIADLKREKVLALEEDDHSSVVEIDDKIDELKESKKELKAEVIAEEEHPINADVAPNPVFTEWVGTNKWYQNDVILRGAADAIGMQYADNNKGAPIDEVLEFVTKEMKKEFPQKLGVKQTSKSPAVTEKGSSGKRVKKAKYSERDLSDEQRQFAKMFVETGAFDSMQDYVDQLAESGEL